ncbi:MAG: hypothetical protein WBD40_10090 [Tepidisphaeraceae bacterium]
MEAAMSRSRATVIVALLFAMMDSGCDQTRLPDLPLAVSHRTSALGKGYVAHFRNTSNKHMVFKVRLINRTLNQQKEDSLELGPYGTTEIGWLEGWQFASGETIEVSQDGFKSQSWRIP